MLPIRFACLRLTVRLLCLSLLLLVLGAANPGSSEARPLARWGVEEFQALLIDPKRDPDLDASSAGKTLAEYRRKLRQAAKELPSLGEVTRVLLLSEWSAAEYSGDSVPTDQLRKAISQPSDDAFKSDVRKMLASHPDDRRNVYRDIVAEIRREVRMQLLERLDKRLHYYLLEGRTEDRIAAANLVSDAMNTSRRQDISQFEGVPGVMRTESKDIKPNSQRFRERMRERSGDLEKLLADSNPQVQIAAIRALSDLEREPGDLVVLLKPLLTSPDVSPLTRRAAAEGMGHVLEVKTASMDRSRPDPYLKNVQQVLPAAAEGLTDSDARVRRASLEACQRAALILNELASDPFASSDRRIVFQPTLAVVEGILIKLNASSRDRVPELRIGACRVLETLALTIQKLKRQNEEYLPRPSSEPSNPEMTPSKEGDKNKSLSPPAGRGGRQASSRRSPQWATVREEQPSWMPRPLPAPLVPISYRDTAAPDVALSRPVKLPAERVIQAQASSPSRSPDAQPLVRTAYQPPQNDDLPPPVPVDPAIQETVKTMIANLKHPDYRVRLAAVDTLETFGVRAETAIPSLVAALKDYNKFVRWAAARTLGRLHPRGAEEVVPGLMAMLDDREDPSVRITAAYSLELYGEHARKAVPTLARVINRGDKEYILAILHTIQGIGTDAAPALPNVAWILRDREQPSSVRIEAAQTLGRFGDLARQQLPILRDIMINDPDESVRNAASTAVLAVDRPQQMK